MMWGSVSDPPDPGGEEVCLIDSGISHLADLHLKPNIQVLNLHCNQIERIENLNKFHSLRHLDLSSNQISDIQGLGNLLSLRTLNLSCNQIETVQGLENLRSLVKLNLSYNQISNVSGLQALEGPEYKLSHLELQGNRLLSIDHIGRCLEGAVNLRRLTLSQGGADNPCGQQEGYRQKLLSMLPKLHILDGTDRYGNPSGDLDILSDIPGLEQYMDFLQSNGGSEMDVSAVITPKIDAALEAFRHNRGPALTPDVSTVTASDTEVSTTQQRAAPTKPQSPRRDQARGKVRDGRKLSVDHEVRLETLEHQMLNLLYSSREATSSGLDTSATEPPIRARQQKVQHPAKRDIDETDESDEGEKRKTKSKLKSRQVTVKARVSKTGPSSKGKKTTRSKSQEKQCSEDLVIRGRSPSPQARSSGRPRSPGPAKPHDVETDQTRTQFDSQSFTGQVQDHLLRNDVQATYVQIMKELEVERERRWKAEQASKKLVEHIKSLQSKAKDGEDLQGVAVQATSRLKEALMNEREIKLRQQDQMDNLQDQVSELSKKLQESQKSEEQCREALRTADETNVSQGKEQLRQQAHEAKRLQEVTLKAAAASREVDILRNNVTSLKGQVQQMQELLANREQQHRRELEGRYSLESKELQDMLQREIDRVEKSYKTQIDALNQKLLEMTKDYNYLENEFRMGLQMESDRFTQLKSAYEKLTEESAENKQALSAAKQKDEKTTSMINELTSLVKEQKGRITELSKAKQEQALEHRERVQNLESHLEEARRRMVTLELLKQEKTKLQAQLTAQTSLIEGVRAEKKVWGEELAQHESSLAQDRGRMEAKIEALNSEVISLKKQLEREADAVRIKSKMIEDQTETIKRLKEGVQERDADIKRTREESLKIQQTLEEQLTAETMASQDLQEKLDRARDRKEELKQQIIELEEKLDDSKKAHSVLNRKWKEKSSLIGQLEEQVTAMKESWEKKEHKLIQERDKAVDAASLAVEKLRSMDDAFRKQLDSKVEAHQRAVQELQQQKQEEVDMANSRILEVEEELRVLLRENEANKRTMEERVKKLNKAFSDLQHDLL